MKTYPNYDVIFEELSKGLDVEQTMVKRENIKEHQVLSELRTIAIGGPRQTGKTRFAIEKACSHMSKGMFNDQPNVLFIARDHDSLIAAKDRARNIACVTVYGRDGSDAAPTGWATFMENIDRKIHNSFRTMHVSNPDIKGFPNYAIDLHGFFASTKPAPTKLLVVLDGLSGAMVRDVYEQLTHKITKQDFVGAGTRDCISPYDVTVLRML